MLRATPNTAGGGAGRCRKLIIAIDGPAGSGKSSTAKYLAEKLNLPYIDTGAMYRAVTLEALRKKISFQDVERLVEITKKIHISFAKSRLGEQKVYLNGKDVTRQIRTPELTKNVFYMAQEPRIRREMVKKQRALGLKEGAVMEGRDIGTVVFPKADFKFYFDAKISTRALRRWRELGVEKGRVTLGQVRKEIRARDATDRTRKEGALKVAGNAQVLDTTSLTIAQTADRILRIIGKKR